MIGVGVGVGGRVSAEGAGCAMSQCAYFGSESKLVIHYWVSCFPAFFRVFFSCAVVIQFQVLFSVNTVFSHTVFTSI